MIHEMPHLCTILKRQKKQKLTYTGGAGTPVVGETVTGGTSTYTGIVDRVATGYIVVKTLTGTFTVGETITTALFSGTLATISYYQNSSGEYEYYWDIDKANVRCKFYRSSARIIVIAPGATIDRPLKCALPSTTTITAKTAIDYKISTTETQFDGTYSISNFVPLQGLSLRIDHFEVTLVAP